MIVQALVKRYEDTLDVPVGWQLRGVSYALDIDENGCLHSIVRLETDDKKSIKKRTFVLPQEYIRSSGVKAAFLCDNGSYFLGLDEKRGMEKFGSAQELHVKVLENNDTIFASAIRAYFSAHMPDNIAKLAEDISTDLKTLASKLCIFQVNGHFADISNDSLRRSWNDYYLSENDKEAEKSFCLVTGNRTAMERVHGKIKFGKTAGGATFIGVNQESFASYGKTRADRATDIGKYAAFAYVTSLNAMLKDRNHRRQIGSDTLVYWAEKGGEAEEDLFGNLFDPLPEMDEPQNLSDIVARIARGDYVTEYKPNLKFYLLCLSSNAARISVRFFYTDNFGGLIRNLKSHYDRLEIVNDGRVARQFLPLWQILQHTTVKAESAAKANPLLGGQVLSSILSGSSYPLTLYHSMLARIIAGDIISKEKAAVIKAVLTKNFKESEVTTVGLNEQSDNQPYVLGRLFSVLERLQATANGSSSIRERYFASACANPNIVFPKLLNLSIHHAAKIDKAVFYEKLKGELLSHLDEESPFPAVLGLEGQGKFILGYYHQTQWFFTKRDKKEELVNE
ncbi:MAG: type I-C CRISPR-associated protein Cas8c/Csd1 [Dehalococcoidia bacterium]|nr:type I-C CRISPR-associated protein Cas8c/Csd1 [Dehalococcoidia bacterium]